MAPLDSLPLEVIERRIARSSKQVCLGLVDAAGLGFPAGTFQIDIMGDVLGSFHAADNPGNEADQVAMVRPHQIAQPGPAYFWHRATAIVVIRSGQQRVAGA